MSDVTIYHNPDCGTSRNTLGLIRQAGIAPEVIDYLKTPPSPARLAQLAARAGLAIRSLVREKGTPYRDLGLDNPAVDDDALLAAMMTHPILINRPIVVTPKGVKLCRPSDIVIDLLLSAPRSDIKKEDGVSFLKDHAIAADDPALARALAADGLPIADLGEGNRTFFAYATLAGAIVGYGGFELFGQAALLRSIAVLPGMRGKRIGRNIVPLLLYRAHERGAREAWLLTTSAAAFFERLGFTARQRNAAPAAILASRQAADLCPASATLLAHRIGF